MMFIGRSTQAPARASAEKPTGASDQLGIQCDRGVKHLGDWTVFLQHDFTSRVEASHPIVPIDGVRIGLLAT
jgi:hypothetical protein